MCWDSQTGLIFWTSNASLPEDVKLTTANRVADERGKKRKDDEDSSLSSFDWDGLEREGEEASSQLVGPFPFHALGRRGGRAPGDDGDRAFRSIRAFQTRGGSKRQRADEAQSGSGEPTPKRHHRWVPR
jgi:hypothetical protein